MIEFRYDNNKEKKDKNNLSEENFIYILYIAIRQNSIFASQFKNAV